MQSLAQPGVYGGKDAADLLKKLSIAKHDLVIRECANWDRRNLLDIVYGYANAAAYLVSPLATGGSISSGAQFAKANTRMILALYMVEVAAVYGGHKKSIDTNQVRPMLEMALDAIT
jgi:hypothetical protein